MLQLCQPPSGGKRTQHRLSPESCQRELVPLPPPLPSRHQLLPEWSSSLSYTLVPSTGSSYGKLPADVYHEPINLSGTNGTIADESPHNTHFLVFPLCVVQRWLSVVGPVSCIWLTEVKSNARKSDLKEWRFHIHDYIIGGLSYQCLPLSSFWLWRHNTHGVSYWWKGLIDWVSNLGWNWGFQLDTCLELNAVAIEGAGERESECQSFHHHVQHPRLQPCRGPS